MSVLVEVSGQLQGLLLPGADQRWRVELVHQPVDAPAVGAHVPAAAAVAAEDQPVLGHRDVGGWEDSAPGVVADVLLRRAARHQLRPHRRVRTVRPDEHVGVRAAAIGQPNRDPVRVLLVVREPGGQADVLPPGRVGEEIGQLRPVHQQELVVGHAEPRRVEQLPGGVVEVHLAGSADGPELLADTEVVEDRQRVGPQPQPGPGSAHLRRLFVDHHLDARAAQCEPTRQAHDPATDNYCPHQSSPSSRSSLRSTVGSRRRFIPVQRRYTVFSAATIGRWTTTST